MTDQLARLRADTAADLATDEAEIRRLQDRIGIYKHLLYRIDTAMAEDVAPVETPAETERREKRDIRGAILGVLEGQYRGMPPGDLLSRVVANIGNLTESALARSLSSLVGSGDIVEVDGVFSLPAGAATGPAVSRLGIGFLSGEQAAK